MKSEVARRMRSLATLRAVADATAGSHDFCGTAQRIVDAVADAAEFTAVALYVVDEDRTELQLCGVRDPGQPGDELPRRLPLDTGLGTELAHAQSLVWLGDRSSYDALHPALRARLTQLGMEAAVSIPLAFRGQMLGVLGMACPKRRRFDAENEAEFQTLGTIAAAALMNARYVARTEEQARERERIEAELRNHRDVLMQTAENVGGVLWLFDVADRRVLYLSASFERLTGYPSERMLENPDLALELIHPGDLERVLAVTGTGELKDYEVEYRMVRADGEVRAVHERLVVLRDEQGSPTRAVGFVQDVTRVREMHAQVRHAQKMEIVDRLAGSVAHDFNNLLTVITGNAELLRDGPTDEAEETLGGILQAADRASQLTRRLLTLARKQPVLLASLDLGGLVRELEGLLVSVLGPGIELVLDLGEEPLHVRGDAVQLEQVLVNLAVNAADAMPDGGRLEISTAAVGERVALCVRDSGVGMSPELRELAFEPFFTTKEAGRGTGLGLAIVRNIVEEIDGEVRLTSEPGRGTCLEIDLPRTRAGEIKRPPTRETADWGRGETVLLVEDEPEVCRIGARALRQRGYRVLEATSGEHALALAEEMGDEIALLVSDVVMPGMRGTELAAELTRRRPDLPVLLVSGYTGRTAEAAELDGSQAFLAKPFTPNALAEAVRKILDRKADPPAASTHPG